jgi:hypothetical protein
MCIEHDALAAAYALTDRPYKFGVVDGEPLVELALATKNGKTVNQNCFLTLHFLCNLHSKVIDPYSHTYFIRPDISPIQIIYKN